MSLSDTEIERYARHLLLREIGGPGQQKLKAARVLVVGAGGLGSPVLHYLAAAGVGTLGVVDDDVVALSNLQRQVLHASAHVGMAKTESAALGLAAQNPEIDVVCHDVRLDAGNALALVAGWDIVADGTDNFATRYIVSDACYLAKKPLVSAAVGRFEGQLTTLMPFASDPGGAPNPTYRCLFPKQPAPGTVPACEEAGILGVVTGILGTLQANEVLKLILGLGQPLVGRVLMVDVLEPAFDIFRYAWRPDNPLSGTPRRIGANTLGQLT
ncbi:MAG: HesA/MoeB/ThiF family protein [Alphaproteobacteria bacterium]